MFGDLVDKKYPSITIQGVLLASSVLYLEHGGLNILIIFTISIILSLFVLQAINHRFFYYFPGNIFAEKETKNVDTYILYSMTLVAFLFFIWGVAKSFILSLALTAFIIFPGFLWKKYVYKKIRTDITEKLKNKNYIRFIRCPYCGAKAIRGRRVLEWNEGYEIFECLDGCKKKSQWFVLLNIG